jgi:tetratricopeptide (TPR) repeat protein
MTTTDRYLVKVRHYPRMLRNSTASLPEPQPWDGMVSLAKKEFVQGILVLESFDVNQVQEVFAVSEGGFVANQKVDITTGIRVYEPDKRRFAEDSVYTFTRSFRSVGKTEQAALAGLPDPHSSAFQACDFAAGEYAKIILPGSGPAERNYYAKGDSLMLVADSALQKGNWGRAESKWARLAYEAKDTLIQAQASYNMALACERNGRLNQAIGYAKRSERLNPDKKTREYVNLLEAKMAAYLKQVDDKTIIRYW